MAEHREVTVIYDQEGKITVVPFKVKIFPDEQKIRWRLVSQVPDVKWADPGIFIETDPPPPFQPWPGEPAHVCAQHPNDWCANADAPNTGTDPIQYMYWVILDVPERGIIRFAFGADAALKSELMQPFDPDISNEPPRP
jgi:hypothetical protein